MTYNVFSGTINPTQSINQTFGMNSPNNRLLSDAGLVCIPDVTKVTLTSMRLWQTATGLMVISYRAPEAAVCKPLACDALSAQRHNIPPKSEGLSLLATTLALSPSLGCYHLHPPSSFIIINYLQWFENADWASARESGVQKIKWWGAGKVLCLDWVQMICIWSSCCYCHPIISCFIKI